VLPQASAAPASEHDEAPAAPTPTLLGPASGLPGTASPAAALPTMLDAIPDPAALARPRLSPCSPTDAAYTPCSRPPPSCSRLLPPCSRPLPPAPFCPICALLWSSDGICRGGRDLAGDGICHHDLPPGCRGGRDLAGKESSLLFPLAGARLCHKEAARVWAAAARARFLAGARWERGRRRGS
jgi:hypothetical protein